MIAEEVIREVADEQGIDPERLLAAVERGMGSEALPAPLPPPRAEAKIMADLNSLDAELAPLAARETARQKARKRIEGVLAKARRAHRRGELLDGLPSWWIQNHYARERRGPAYAIRQGEAALEALRDNADSTLVDQAADGEPWKAKVSEEALKILRARRAALGSELQRRRQGAGEPRLFLVLRGSHSIGVNGERRIFRPGSLMPLDEWAHGSRRHQVLDLESV